MTYDSRDGYLILFGGIAASSLYLNDTWSFQNNTWTNLTAANPNATNTPSARGDGPMAYDATDGYVIMFGGDVSGGSVRDYRSTWAFQAGVWTDVSPTPITAANSPPWMDNAALAFDSADGYVVLTGGQWSVGGAPSYTWTYSHGSWTNISVTPVSAWNNPPPGQIQFLTYDAAAGGTLLASARGGSNWFFSHGTWSDLNLTTGPGPRYNPSVSYDDRNQIMVEFGGYAYPACGGLNNYYCADTWEWVNGTWIQASPLQAPSARYGAAMGYDESTGQVVLFSGGLDSGAYATDTWTLTYPLQISQFAVGPPELDAGQSINGSLSVTGGVGVISIAWNSSAPWCHPAPNATQFTCVQSTTGSYLINATVRGSLDSTTVVADSAPIEVYDPPTVSTPGFQPSPVALGAMLSATTIVAGGSPPVTITWHGLPPGCPSMDAASMSCTPASAGSFVAYVGVTDWAGFQSTSPSTTLVVDSPLVVGTISANRTSLDVGQGVTLQVSSSGGTPPLAYNWKGLPPGCTSVDASTLSCLPTAGGNFSVQVSVSDAVGLVATTGPALIAVADQMRAGVVASSASLLDLGQSATLLATFTGGAGPYSVSWTGLPPGCSSGGSASLGCKPSSAGGWDISAVVADSQGESVDVGPTRLVAVPDPAIKNLSASETSIQTGDTVTFTVAFSPGVGADTLTWSGLLASCAPASNNSSIVSCTFPSSGAFNVSVKLTDRAGFQSVSRVIEITVLGGVGSVGNSPSGTPLAGIELWLVVGVAALVLVGGIAFLWIRRRPPTAPE